MSCTGASLGVARSERRARYATGTRHGMAPFGRRHAELGHLELVQSLPLLDFQKWKLGVSSREKRGETLLGARSAASHIRTVMAVSTRRSSPARIPRDGNATTGGFVFCVLLALQYALQPFLNGRCISPGVNKLSLVLGTEVAKIVIAAVLMTIEGPGSFRRTFKGWTLQAASLSLLPSLVYAVQNYLLVVGASLLDGVTFNCLNQSKLISTAFFVWAVFGVTQSGVQMMALAGLLCATMLLQEGGNGSGGGKSGGQHDDSSSNQLNQSYGVLAVLFASALSGVASAATQFSLQKLGRTSTALTVEMACAAIPCLLIANLMSYGVEGMEGFFHGWTLKTVAPIISSAVGGISVGQITKHLGGVAKGFSIVGGLVLTGVAQGLIGLGGGSGEGLGFKHVAALVLVVLCTYCHARFPPKKISKKKKKSE